MADKMNIQQKIEELIIYSETQIAQFPDEYRSTVGATILMTLYGIAELAESANRSEAKAPILSELDIKNGILKRMLYHGQLVNNLDRPAIDGETYSVWIEKANEIGRMIGGWIRSQNGTHKRAEAERER